MGDHPVEGEWGNFVFKMIKPEDHPKILKHMRDCFYYRALFRVGYTKEMDDEMETVFEPVLHDGHNLSFYAEDKATGKVAGCRIITMEKRGPSKPSTTPNRICRGFVNFYYSLVDECNVCDKYKVDEYPHMFGISVDPEFCQQGLAIEIYRRAKELVKWRGYDFALVAFISPYSRAAAMHHDFKEMAKRSLLEAVDDEGNVLYPQADPNDFTNMGVFELK